MRKNDCAIYLANCIDADAEFLYKEFGSKFEPKRADRILKGTNDKARRNQILTGALLVRALADYNLDPSFIDYGSFEKPFIRGEKNFFFNISHSGDYIAVGVAGRELGVDIQKPAAYKENLVKKICSPLEREQREKDIINRFNRIWALKESFSKLKSDGILLDFTRITYEENESGADVFLDGNKCAVSKEIMLQDGYAMFVTEYADFKISNIINVCL